MLHALRLHGLCDGPEEQGDQEGHAQRAGGLRLHQQRGAGGDYVPRDHYHGEDTRGWGFHLFGAPPNVCGVSRFREKPELNPKILVLCHY